MYQFSYIHFNVANPEGKSAELMMYIFYYPQMYILYYPQMYIL